MVIFMNYQLEGFFSHWRYSPNLGLGLLHETLREGFYASENLAQKYFV
jgi:hypothetical protein